MALMSGIKSLTSFFYCTSLQMNNAKRIREATFQMVFFILRTLELTFMI